MFLALTVRYQLCELLGFAVALGLETVLSLFVDPHIFYYYIFFFRLRLRCGVLSGVGHRGLGNEGGGYSLGPCSIFFSVSRLVSLGRQEVLTRASAPDLKHDVWPGNKHVFRDRTGYT